MGKVAHMHPCRAESFRPHPRVSDFSQIGHQVDMSVTNQKTECFVEGPRTRRTSRFLWQSRRSSRLPVRESLRESHCDK